MSTSYHTIPPVGYEPVLAAAIHAGYSLAPGVLDREKRQSAIISEKPNGKNWLHVYRKDDDGAEFERMGNSDPAEIMARLAASFRCDFIDETTGENVTSG